MTVLLQKIRYYNLCYTFIIIFFSIIYIYLTFSQIIMRHSLFFLSFSFSLILYFFLLFVKCQPCTTVRPCSYKRTENGPPYNIKKGLKDSPQWRENSNSIRERDMSVSIDAEKRRQTWRESGVSSKGRNLCARVWAKTARNGAVDTGLAFDIIVLLFCLSCENSLW